MKTTLWHTFYRKIFRKKKRFLCHARSQAKANDKAKKKKHIHIIQANNGINTQYEYKKKSYEEERSGIKSAL